MVKLGQQAEVGVEDEAENESESSLDRSNISDGSINEDLETGQMVAVVNVTLASEEEVEDEFNDAEDYQRVSCVGKFKKNGEPCSYIAKNELGLAIHNGRMHKEVVGQKDGIAN